MSRFGRLRIALIVILGCFIGFASDGGTTTIRTYQVEGGAKYLVNEEGKVLYLFHPSGAYVYPLAEVWPEPSRSWVRMWKPFLVDGPGAVDFGADIDPANFKAVEKVRDGETTYHVHWGVIETDREPFWGLYTFVFDQPLEHYDVLHGDHPPGWVSELWVPAEWQSAPEPVNRQRLDDELGGGVGNVSGGGP